MRLLPKELLALQELRGQEQEQQLQELVRVQGLERQQLLQEQMQGYQQQQQGRNA